MNTPFQYVRDYYGIPAELGRRVTVYGQPGIIAADRGHYIGVNFDSKKPGHIDNCHPTDKVEYLEIGKIRKMTRSQARYQRFLDLDGIYEDFHQFLKYDESCR